MKNKIKEILDKHKVVYKDSLVDELEILIAKERGKVCADLFSDRKKYDLEDDDLYIHQKEVETNYVNQDING